MNIIEAIKSGRPFRRSGEGEGSWFYPKTFDDGDTYPFERDDILADDWEIEEPKVTITRTQFWDAYRSAMLEWDERMIMRAPGSKPGAEEIMARLARKLGLEWV